MVASVRLVSSLRIRRQLRRHRRDLALIATVLTLVGVVAAHHSGVLMDMQHDMGMNAAVEMCLAVFTAVGAALVAVVLAVVALGRWRPALTLVPACGLTAPEVPVAKARHGPAAVSILCVNRR